MFLTVLHYYCVLTTIMKISPRCFCAVCDYGASTTLFYDFTPIPVGHDPAMIDLSMFKISVVKAFELPDYEDPTAIMLRL